MTHRLKLWTGIVLNLALFANPLLAQNALPSPSLPPALKNWEQDKPWTVLREITTKLMAHFQQYYPQGMSRDRLDQLARIWAAPDMRDAARFWSSPGMFRELESFQSAHDPRALARREYDGILTADDLSRWLNSKARPTVPMPPRVRKLRARRIVRQCP
jgi:hypothetical protein